MNLTTKKFECQYAIRVKLVSYMTMECKSNCSALARELGVSLSLLSLYIRGRRPMSATFILLIRNRLTGFEYVCDTALMYMGGDKWLKEGVSEQLSTVV